MNIHIHLTADDDSLIKAIKELVHAVQSQCEPQVKQEKILTKICIVCGKEFIPNSNRQMKCKKDCGNEKITPKGQALSKTIREVQRIQQEREKQPYQFNQT